MATQTCTRYVPVRNLNSRGSHRLPFHVDARSLHLLPRRFLKLELIPLRLRSFEDLARAQGQPLKIDSHSQHARYAAASTPQPREGQRGRC
jgi:hypothetical protein